MSRSTDGRPGRSNETPLSGPSYTPARRAPDHRNAPERNAPERNAPERNAPERNAPDHRHAKPPETRPHKPPSDPRMKAAEPRQASARGAPAPFIVRGEAPDEPVLVSIVTTSQDALEYTHAFVAAYCRQRFRVSTAEALAVAAHELLENALNYGSVSGHVLFEIIERLGSAAIRVTNDTIPARLDMLRTHIEKLAQNPEAVMLDEMKRSMGMSRTRPMLGLARIVQEAGLGLEFYVATSRVTVVARAST